MCLTRTLAVFLLTVPLTCCGVAESRIPPVLLNPEPLPEIPAPGASDRQIAGFMLMQEAALNRANAKILAIREIVSR